MFKEKWRKKRKKITAYDNGDRFHTKVDRKSVV